MSTARRASAEPVEIEHDAVCAVCGATIEDDGDIEDSSGWRWFSDGQGGLLTLCPACPPPEQAAPDG